MSKDNRKRGPRSTGSIAVRKKPAQERSQEKLQRILSATEELILQEGFDNLAISAIVELAGINVATFYQTFPNRLSLLRHLAQTYIDDLRMALREEFIQASENMEIIEFIDRLTECAYDFFRQHPAYIAIWGGMQGDKTLKELDIEDSFVNAQDISVLLQRCVPGLSGKALEQTAMLIVLCSSNVFRFASHRSPSEGRFLVDAWKQMLQSHLESF